MLLAGCTLARGLTSTTCPSSRRLLPQAAADYIDFVQVDGITYQARTAGPTGRELHDSDLGAQLQTMFMVQYEPGGVAGTHDHPLEETYLVLEGEVDASFDGRTYRLGPGDTAWAGVGCVHGFSNPADRPVRWLETQAPQPPARHSYRFTRDWDYLRDALA
jgi:quercetin dioxygenase-like cupin family protein